MDEVVNCEKGNYYIENEIVISDTAFFIARDEKAKQPFMIGEKQASAHMTKYKSLMVTTDYVSALKEWNRRLSNAITNLEVRKKPVRM